MRDPAISNLVKLVPHVERLIVAQRVRADTLSADKRNKLLSQLAELERKVELVRRYEKSQAFVSRG